MKRIRGGGGGTARRVGMAEQEGVQREKTGTENGESTAAVREGVFTYVLRSPSVGDVRAMKGKTLRRQGARGLLENPSFLSPN